MLPSARLRAIRLLAASRPDDPLLCRETEARCHAAASCTSDYEDEVLRCAVNLRQNPALREVVGVDDDRLAEGTLVGRVAAERKAREDRFERMMQEKYEALDDEQFQAIVRCRRCGSKEVSWEEKQTRSADEGATVFCVCTACKNRWVVR